MPPNFTSWSGKWGHGKWYFVGKGRRGQMVWDVPSYINTKRFLNHSSQRVQWVNEHLPDGHVMGRISQTHLTTEQLPNVVGFEAEMGQERKILWRWVAGGLQEYLQCTPRVSNWP